MERYECTTGGHNKFYEIDISSKSMAFHATYGKIGSTGTSIFLSSKAKERKVKDLLKKKYVLVNTLAPTTTPFVVTPKVVEIVKGVIIGNSSVNGLGSSVNHYHTVGDEGLVTDIDKKYYKTCIVTVNGIPQEVAIKDVKILRNVSKKEEKDSK